MLRYRDSEPSGSERFVQPATSDSDLVKRWEYNPETDTLQIVMKKKEDIVPGPCKR